MCGQCRQSLIFQDCEYDNLGLTESQLLEMRISRVSARINEIQRSNATRPATLPPSSSMSQMSEAFTKSGPQYCA